jgi:ATP-dependent helicase HrpB
MTRLAPLPVDALLDDIVRRLRAAPALVLRSPTGSGKTTRLPPALDEAGFGPVVLLEPRRVAARAAARRMAEERDERLGERFGYRVRFDSKTSARTRVTAVTEGVYLRKLLSDPWLEGIGCVVFDEFHERHLDGDLALALTRRVQREVRDDLRIVVLSATLDPAPVAAYLDADVVASEGRLHPIEVLHQPPHGREPLEAQVERGVRALAPRTPGDLLVFLPGMGEIRRSERLLRGSADARGLDIVVLHGDLDPREQDAALRAGPRRKIVLATNLAESSVTVEGVTAVIDSGLARIPRFDAAVGLDRLVPARIPLESVHQRAGRAGREAPGLNLRLWSVLDERSFADSIEPEVARVDLASAWLSLLDFGERDPAAFEWFDAPPPGAAAHAGELLEALGATRDGALTELGRELARLPLHPRVGRLLVAGRELGCLDRAALAAALLSDRDPLRRVLSDFARFDRERVHDSDVLERVELLERALAGGHVGLSRSAVQRVRATRDQLLRSLAGGRGHAVAHDIDEALLRAVFNAFADRIARKRPRAGGGARAPGKRPPRPGRGDPTTGVRRSHATRDDEEGAQLCGGRGVRLASECRVRDAELFVCVDVDAGDGEGVVRQASFVDRAWLDPDQLRESLRCTFDASRDVATIERVTTWRGLAIAESPTGSGPESAEATRALEEALAAAARKAPERAFDLAAEACVQLFARLGSLAEWMPELGLDGAGPREWVLAQLDELVAGRRSFAHLRAIDLATERSARLDHRARAELERSAPARMALPLGRSARLAYEAGRPPVLAARIQDFFGLDATPAVCGGRVPVLLHLCAPNGRVEQITGDLPGFWRGTYAQVRKDLRGRYPKHDWPEDPVGFEPRGRRR